MRAVHAAILSAVLILISPACLDWPLEDPELLSTFGEGVSEAFRAGISLGRRGQPVHSIADGEIVFSHVDGRSSSLPRGAGSFVVVQHEGGIQSVYGHLDRINTDLVTVRARQSTGARQAVLGTVGDSGATEGPGLSLMIVDAREKRFLNPVKIEKPPLSSVDGLLAAGPPTIEGAFLLQSGRRIALGESTQINAGAGEILVVAYDTISHGSYGRRATPYRLSVSSSGRLSAVVTFDALIEREGRLVVPSTGQSFEQLYRGPWTFGMGRLTFPEGRTHVQVRVDGIAGGSITRDYHIEAKP